MMSRSRMHICRCKRKRNDLTTCIALRKAIADAAAAAGICSSVGRNEYTDCASYLVHIQLTAAERAVLS